MITLLLLLLSLVTRDLFVLATDFDTATDGT